jgi:hypothetical protein
MGSSMGLDLTPRDYLEMLRDEYREYQDHWHVHGYRVSIRKAINCCGHSNALPEIIFAHYSDTEPKKVHHTNNHNAYRAHLQAQCKAHLTVQDICEFYKHGPTLRRQSPTARPRVSVQIVNRIIRQEGFFRGLLGLTENREVERLEVRHEREGRTERTEPMDEVLEQVIASWSAIFDEDTL